MHRLVLSDKVCAFCLHGDFATRNISEGAEITLTGQVVERVRMVDGVECHKAELRTKTLGHLDRRGGFMPFESYCPYWQALRDGND